MSDNYMKFSAILDVGSTANVEKALKIFSSRKEKQFDVQPSDETALWISSGDEDYGGIDDVCDFVKIIGKKLKLTGKWGFTWAFYCSRLSPGDFDGGAFFINFDDEEEAFINASTWLNEKLNPKKTKLKSKKTKLKSKKT